MSDTIGQLVERFTTAADRLPLFDATVIYRPDIRADAALPLAKQIAAQDHKHSEAEHLEFLSTGVPPGGISLTEWRDPEVSSFGFKIGRPRVPKGGVIARGRPEWMVFVYWPKGDRSAGRLLTTLCAEAGELLGDAGQGETTDQSWLVHLAECQPVKWVQDHLPPEGFPFQRVGWRETDGTDCEWWAAILKNVLNLSAKALRESIPSDSRKGNKLPPTKAERKRVGRKSTDLKGDTRVWDAWHSREHVDYAALARALGVKKADVVKAMDRERKRRGRAAG